MRKLAFLPFLVFAFGCSDSTPVEPEMDLSPELSVALQQGGMGDVVKMVPFKAKQTWWPGDGDPNACDHFKGDYPAVSASYPMFEGTATHLGYHTGSAFNCIDLATFQLLTSSQEIVAANGDKLFFYGSIGDGTVIVIDWTDPNLSFEILGLTFVGGTGRFENASGRVDLSSESLYGGSAVMKGEISSVGSSK